MLLQDRPGVRLFNAAAGICHRMGLRKIRFDPQLIEAAARKTVQYENFGSDRYRHPLELLCQDYDRDQNLTPLGKLVCQKSLVHVLSNRLKIQQAVETDPEITRENIRRPLFILGLPRTGTTLLYNLLAEDPAARPLMFWESMSPAPPPRTENYASDPRIARGRQRVQRLNQIFPELKHIHEFRGDGPEECLGLLMNCLLTPFMRGEITRYRQWLDDVPDAEVDAAYAEYRLQLQLLQRHVQRDHWILKCPSHLYGLGSILKTFPDAAVVQTHRDLSQAVPSLCSLGGVVEQLCYRKIDKSWIGLYTLRTIEQMLDRGVRGRDAVDPQGERVLDLNFQNIVADPIGVVRKIYERFSYPFTPEFEAALKHKVATDQHAHQPKHAYRLSEFSLTEIDLTQRFRDYSDRFIGSAQPQKNAVPVTQNFDTALGAVRQVRHGAAKIEYFSRGTGPAVVLLPALAATVQEFEPLIAALNATGYRTLAIHFPGVGESDQPIRSQPTLWDFADQIATVLEDAGVPAAERAVLVGRGLGNRVARTFATRYRSRTAAIVLLGAGGKGRGRPDRSVIRKYLALQIPGLSLPRRRKILESLLCVGRDVLPDHACRKPSFRALRLQAGAVLRTKSEAWHAGGTAPILVIQGEQDQVAPPRLAEDLRQEFPDRVELAPVPNAGHALLYDQPEFVSRRIVEFLQGRELAAEADREDDLRSVTLETPSLVSN